MATNPYYQNSIDLIPGNKARAGDVEADFDAVQAGFDVVDADIQSLELLKAPLVSPAFTDTPTAPTAVAGTSTAQLASTLFVQNAIAAAAALSLPTVAGNAGKFLTTDGTSVAWGEAVNKAGDTMTGPLNLPTDGLAVGTLQLVMSGGNLGIGLASPSRMFHMQGNNAVMRFDRDANSVGIQLHRFPTGDYTIPWKGYALLVAASGPGDGSFSIADYGTAVGGAPTNRLVIDNVGRFQVMNGYDGTTTAVAGTDIDCRLGNDFTKTINGSTTLTFSNAPASRTYSFTLEITHTSGTITWPASVKWPGDVAPSLTTGKTHNFVFVTRNGGTRWRGAALPNYTT